MTKSGVKSAHGVAWSPEKTTAAGKATYLKAHYAAVTPWQRTSLCLSSSRRLIGDSDHADRRTLRRIPQPAARPARTRASVPGSGTGA